MMKKLRYLGSILYTFAFSALVYADQTTFGPTTDGARGTFGPSGASKTLQNPLFTNSIQELLTAILDVVVTIGTPIAILLIVYAGFLFATAQGNDEKLTNAKKTFLWTVVGVIVLLGAKLLSVILANTVRSVTGGIL